MEKCNETPPKINTESGKNAAIFSYAAHATCYGHKQRDLSGDYPGRLTSMLEMTREIDFAVYGAGAVGSICLLYTSPSPRDS